MLRNAPGGRRSRPGLRGVDDGGLDRAEVDRTDGPPGVAPARLVHDDRRPRSPRPRPGVVGGGALTSLRSALLSSGVAAAAGPATAKSAFTSASFSPVRSVRAPPKQPPAASPTPLGVDRDPRRRERLEVAAGGALGHLELGRGRRRGEALAALEQEEEGDQPVGAHTPMLAGKVASRWPVSSGPCCEYPNERSHSMPQLVRHRDPLHGPRRRSTDAERADLLGPSDKHRSFLRFTVQGLTDEQAARADHGERAVPRRAHQARRTGVEERWVNFIEQGPSVMRRNEPGCHGRPRPQLPDGGWGAVGGLARPVPGDGGAHGRTRADPALTGRAPTSFPMPLGSHRTPAGRARRVLLHIIAETAQHAGHADILREAIDGQKTMG